ncbi:aspartate/ornithine carbamoyltransferase family protein [Novosphingobium mangrovi (ex Huang et al. 2023)]|uniref:Aspartate carbamoyltransferase n=1 Tax=Novosphingobium mangrovi (ex Huang et al. 2023) TaxID=2976432 RepID=A0ABT2I560_9SPHN|nr:aspartate carbamoyltransferase [Novosphingobium mangrovi (ex Huang et al. 2023)]MCT2399937.1 aspartate carbamoyltransferase [Novosphingobium mangrovi (ex Huang et al. 2023)]
MNLPASQVEHIADSERKAGVIGNCPDPSGLLKHDPKLRLDVLDRLHDCSVLSAAQFDHDLLCELTKLAAYLQLKQFPVMHALDDKIMAAAFFEPSTRTRLSFESAMLHLGGKTISVADAKTTGVAKGESLRDIGQMFNSYADVVAVRHTEQSAIKELCDYLRIPLLNGGNGSDEHPTQALADWYALLKWRPEIAYGTLPDQFRLNIGIIGTPGNMRTVKSFLILALLFHKNISHITIFSEMADPLGEEIRELTNASPIGIDFSQNLQQSLEYLDVIYMNAIAYLGDGYRFFGDAFSLDAESKLKPDTVILHPLARGEELDISLDDTVHNLYFNQADGAVWIRQALLLAVFGRVGDVVPQEYLA